MGFKDSLRKLMKGDQSYYERAARAAAEVSSKKAVRGRIAEHELKGLRTMHQKPEHKARILAHTAMREKGLKKVSFIMGFKKVFGGIC